ncbi:MAG: FIST C-terminal domain-containing protein [Candidatus Omnitrophica bacterium]|nr:FIST C-terminal domain-containing protein [Candidatus Omnitrophota bacterium]
MQVGIGLSSARDHLQATKEAVVQARANLRKDKIDFVIVFTTPEFAHPLILKTITNLVGPIPILGCSGLAVISNQGGLKDGLGIILVRLSEEIHFNVAVIKEISVKSALHAGEELGEKLLLGLRGTPRNLSLIFSDGLIPNHAGLLNGLQEKLGLSFPLVGACASDNLFFKKKKTYIYFNQEILSDAACGLIWTGKVNFALGIRHGWKPLGKPRLVTRSEGNIIYEIDHQPAVKIYEEYLARDVANLKKDLKTISILYPLGIPISAEEEYLLRNIISIQEDGSLVFQGNIPEGCSVRMMIGTKESCLQATQQAAEEVKMRLGSRESKFVLVFDSVSRYMLLGRQAEQEIQIIKNNLGKDIPFLGIYTYGEQAPLKAISYLGRTYFHNQTITLVGIGG